MTSRPNPPTRPDDSSGEPSEPRRPEDPGSLRPTPFTVVVLWALAGLVGGWLLHKVAVWLGGNAPLVSWFQPAALWLVAVAVWITWWHTWRTVQVRHERLEPHRAVNRLAFARAAALVGALVAGGYAGYALSWVGVDAQLGPQRITRSVIALIAGVVIVAGGLMLERACRVRKDRKDD